MPYTSHGHWYGPGEATLPTPAQRARCGGSLGCRVCIAEAGRHSDCGESTNPRPSPILKESDMEYTRLGASIPGGPDTARVKLAGARDHLARNPIPHPERVHEALDMIPLLLRELEAAYREIDRLRAAEPVRAEESQ